MKNNILYTYGDGHTTQQMKLHLGCGEVNFGPEWIHIEDGDYSHLDYKSNVSEIDKFIEDNSVDLIYASHVIAYFDRKEIISVLKKWYNLLKSNGVLRLATPDFEAMTNLYKYGNYSLDKFIGPMYGKMKMGKEIIYHKTIYDYSSLSEIILKDIGFKSCKKYDWIETEHNKFDDYSQAYLPHMDKKNGTLISLNIEAIK